MENKELIENTTGIDNVKKGSIRPLICDPSAYMVVPRKEYEELIAIKAAHELEEYKSKYWDMRLKIDKLEEEIKTLKGETDETVEKENDQA